MKLSLILTTKPMITPWVGLTQKLKHRVHYYYMDCCMPLTETHMVWWLQDKITINYSWYDSWNNSWNDSWTSCSHYRYSYKSFTKEQVLMNKFPRLNLLA